MKHFFFLAILFVACNTTTDLRVHDLRCEYMVNPLGIDVRSPHFSWKLSGDGDKRGQSQTAYRILVASGAGKLDNDEGDVWDSGIITSAQSHLVAYRGPQLQSGGDYYWKVKVYDQENRELPWSSTARFSMGLLERSDWKGEWIKHPSASPEKHIWFRKKLSIEDEVSTAFIYVASSGYHELYINGKKADERVLAPAVSRLDNRVLYVTYDIGTLLTKGDNVISLWYGPGWTRNNFFAPLVEQAVIVQLNGKTKKGGSFSSWSDQSWKCAESYSRNTGRYELGDMGGEEIDGRRYAPEWNTITFDDSQWPTAGKATPSLKGPEPILSAQMTDASRIIDTLAARQLSDTIQGVLQMDIGKNFTGFLEANFNGLSAGDTVVISVSSRPDVLEHFKQRQFYIARGENGEKFMNRFNFFSGRYIHFAGLKQPLKLSDVRGYAISSAGERTGSFESSDSLYNKIYDIDRWTFEMCHTEGVIVDCPNRERLGYGPEGAYQTTWGLGLPCFSSGAYYMKNIRDWSDVQKPDGSINNVAPQISRMYGGSLNGASQMNLAWEHYHAYGDKRVLEEAYGTGKKWLGFLDGYVSDSLLTPYDKNGFFLGEWVSPGPKFEYCCTPESLFFNNCVYAMTLDLFIRIAKLVDRDAETAVYQEKLKAVRTKMHRKYFDPAINSYLNGDQVRTSFSLFAGIVPDSLQPRVLDHLEKDLTGAHPYFDIGSFTRYPYFHVLFAHSRFQQPVADILSKKTYPGYGYFISRGETTWPEVWEIDSAGGSHIHTSYAGISAWFIKRLAGIEPDIQDPGYRTFTVSPHVVRNLSHAKASLESPYGTIRSGWRKADGKIIYNISVPIGSNAVIYLPATISGTTESGGPPDQAPGIKSVEETGDRLVIRAGPGDYLFECKSP